MDKIQSIFNWPNDKGKKNEWKKKWKGCMSNIVMITQVKIENKFSAVIIKWKFIIQNRQEYKKRKWIKRERKVLCV